MYWDHEPRQIEDENEDEDEIGRFDEEEEEKEEEEDWTVHGEGYGGRWTRESNPFTFSCVSTFFMVNWQLCLTN